MMSSPVSVPPRSEIPTEFTWNAESVFATLADWETACDAILEALPKVQQFQGRLAEGPAALADYFDAANAISQTMGKVYTYASMSAAVNALDADAVAMQSKAGGLSAQVISAYAFGEPEMLAIGYDTLRHWMQDEPRLAHLGAYFEDLFRRQAHVRAAEVEELLGLVSAPLEAIYDTFSLLMNADVRFRAAQDSSGSEVPVNQGSMNTLLSHADREVRRTAWESYADGHLAYRSALSSNLLTSYKADVFRAKARRYPNTLEASLFANNVPPAVFHNLIDTFRKNLPTWHRYWRIRREALGLDDLHEYDIWAPLTANAPKVSYQQAVEWISAGMAPLGEDYVSALRRGCLQDRWIDVYPNQGKRSGAFSDGSYATHPFIMMSYNNDLGAMSTLAHELGHSMHSYLVRRTQPQIYGDYTLFVAEVASNFNQAMTRAYLMEHNPDRDFQLTLIQETMTNFHRYFFIMPSLARFELEVHQRVERGEAVTTESMNDLMVDLFNEGYGGEMVVDHDRTGITWATFPHLYSAYYVYAYATGISAAHALAERVLTGEPGAAQRYLEALSAGSSLTPLQTLKHAGVDMTLPDAVETTFGVLARMVDRLETLIG